MGLLSQMRGLGPLPADSFPEPDLAVSLLIPAKRAGHALESTVEDAHAFLSNHFPGDFEIVLIPNTDPSDPTDASVRVAQELVGRHPEVVSREHTLPPGKGAALRTGVARCRGRWVFFTDADLPYDLSFFEAAADKLRAGYGFVTGNRRLPESVFVIPVQLLPLAYKRHRLGLWFNSVARRLLKIPTIDTQAGIKAMSREFARFAFADQICPGFFFDLEIFLTCAGRGFRHIDLPVTLYLNSRESTVWLLRESLLAGFWLMRLTWRRWRGAYAAG